jgi:uncharacterized protein (DUF362 family)
MPSLQIGSEKLLESLRSIANFVEAGKQVLLKPNLLTASLPTKECITCPEMVHYMAELIKDVGGKS